MANNKNNEIWRFDGFKRTTAILIAFSLCLIRYFRLSIFYLEQIFNISSGKKHVCLQDGACYHQKLEKGRGQHVNDAVEIWEDVGGKV